MLLPEARLDTLVEQLRSLPAGDRKAILARLSPPERERIRARLRGAGASVAHSSPFAADIAARVAAVSHTGADVPMTAAGKAALTKALAIKPDSASAATPPPGSLVDAVAGLWRKRGAV